MNELNLSQLSKEELIEMVLNLQKDNLTGFYRREKLNSITINKNYTVGIIDINGLKQVNDNLGHEEGDKYILSVCDSIKKNIRKTDTVIRQGGDEFIIVFDNCTVEEAKMICNRVTNASSGVGEAETIEEAIKIADKNMYDNKRNYYLEINKAV